MSQTVKSPPAMRETWLRSQVGKIPGKGNGYPPQYSCQENARERSLLGYSPCGHKESIKLKNFHFSLWKVKKLKPERLVNEHCISGK